jgi:hypothetical protein
LFFFCNKWCSTCQSIDLCISYISMLPMSVCALFKGNNIVGVNLYFLTLGRNINIGQISAVLSYLHTIHDLSYHAAGVILQKALQGMRKSGQTLGSCLPISHSWSSRTGIVLCICCLFSVGLVVRLLPPGGGTPHLCILAK